MANKKKYTMGNSPSAPAKKAEASEKPEAELNETGKTEENKSEIAETKSETAAAPKPKKSSKAKGERPPYASYICLPEQEEKLKKIAERMKRSKYEVIQAFLQAGIDRYEEKFGKIDVADKEQEFDFL